MDTVYRIAAAGAAAILRIVRSRLFAASALAVITACMVTVVSVNLRAVTVADGETSRVVLTFGGQPNYQVEEHAGVAFDDGTVPAVLAVNPDCDVQVTADGVCTIVRMTEGTVADVLTRVGVVLDKFDTLSVPPETPIADGMNVFVSRVQFKDYTKTQSIGYDSSVKYTNLLPRGKTKLHRGGQNGVKTLSYRDKIVEGKVVETVLVEEKVTTQPVAQIMLKGTVLGSPLSKAPIDIPLDEAGQPLKYKTLHTGKATAYTSDRGDSGTRTSLGMKAQVGVVAVNPKRIPYGSKLYIVSADGSYVYGYAIAGDTGGGVCSNKSVADLFMDTYEECIMFGRRIMNVYVIE